MKNLIATCVVLLAMVPAQAQLVAPAQLIREETRTITVTGQGVATAVPDIAYVHLGVLTTADKVNKAVEANKTAMTNVFKSLKTGGIEDKDICTNNFSVAPEYTYLNDKNQTRKLTGYSVSNDVIVTVRNLDKLGELLDALTAEGHANRLDSVSFDVLDKEKALETARERAVTSALAKAKTITKAANVGIDKIMTINESQTLPSAYNQSFRTMTDSAPGSVPLARGERQFKVNVNMVISIK